MAFSLTWLPEVLESAGLKVAEQPGWRTRGHGDIDPIKGVICHHTAGPKTGIMPSLGVVTNGRPGLSGPLAQLCLGRDGTFFAVAAGQAFHAGVGNWQGLTDGNGVFIGIEAENTGHIDGPLADPWPDVQMDAYRRGVAAILKQIGANAIMAAGHKEYALPIGRKVDPTFDMVAFRQQVAAIMAGTAPLPTIIPAEDGFGRPTLRRGATGDLVKRVQTRIGVDADGKFGPATETALRQFQRDNHLVPDGIVGPRTWAAIDGAPSSPQPASPQAATLATDITRKITDIAAVSPVARLAWKDRGTAPIGYVKGMALAYGRVYCKLKAGDAAATDMAQARTASGELDALTWYDDVFTSLGMRNDVAGPDTLRHLFVLLIGLGMRESSGKYCEGRDRSAANTTAETAEAGLFQTSFNARTASLLMPQLFTQYRARPTGFVAEFQEGVHCSEASLENFGSGDGLEFQRLSKACPAFAAEFAAVGLRHIRKHWGPITRKEAQLRPECDAMLSQVQAAVDASPELAAALL